MKFDDVLRKLGLKEESKTSAITKFVFKYWWLWTLILITVFAFWSRSIPAKYGELQALDPFFALRLNEYMLSHNLQLPAHDYMRYWPDGVPLRLYGPILYFYVPVLFYLALTGIGMSMTFLNFAILYPAIMGAFSVFIIFWLAREIFKDNKAGIFAALFLATVPAYIARTSAGFFDKEATGGTFLLLAVFLFLRSYNKNSWKCGILSAAAVIIAMGSWGGAQFLIYIISGFLIIKLLINQYRESMIKSAVIPLIAAVLTQRFIVGYTNWPFEQILAIITIALILIRYGAERYKLVKEEHLPYLIPAVIGVLILSVLIGSMFSDYLWGIVNRFLSLLSIKEKGYIGSTVAESMEGSWSDIVSRTNIAYSSSILGWGPPFDTLFSVWFLMILGSLAVLYSIYTERKWIMIFPLFWLIMSVQTVFFMVRLVFFLGPPASIMAGYALSFAINKMREMKYMKNKEGLKKFNILSIPVIVVIALIITANMVTGYVFCSSVGPSFNQYWADSMKFLSEETPVNSSVLSWWDFGYWFQTRGNRPSTADGGNVNGSVNEQIADWYTANVNNWTDFRPWLEGKDVSYILMDYTLPGKYGAISKIASRGKQVIGMLQFQQNGVYPQDNKTIVEYKAGQYVIWLPIDSAGSLAGAPIFMVTDGSQYIGRSYITGFCTTGGIIKIENPEGSDVMPGCVTNTAYGLFYVPPEAEFSIFTDLMFMDGYGIPDVVKVYDNQLIKIYKLEINETAS